MTSNKTRYGERRGKPEWSGVKIGWWWGWDDKFSTFGVKNSLGEWLTQGKLTPVIVSPFYEPLDSLAVSNFYRIFTIRTRTECCQDTSVCNFPKKWVIFTPLWFRITNYSSHCGELYLLLSAFRNAFCSNRNFQETWHVSRELRLDGRVGFLNEHQEKVHLGAISHGRHDTACFVCIKTNSVLAGPLDY